MRRLLPIPFLSALAACAILTLLGCSGGLDFDNDALPAPSVAIAPTPATCSTAGSGSILFGIEDITVTQNFPAAEPQNRFEVTGTVSGLGMSDTLVAVLLPYADDCPILGTAVAVTDGSTFSVLLDSGDRTAYRVVLVAHAGVVSDLDCSIGTGCLSTAAGAFSAISAGVEVLIQ